MKNLKKIRTQNKKQQQEVADYLGINRVSYARYESGERQPDFQTVANLADYFKVSVDYLLGRTDDPHPVTSNDDVKRPSTNMSRIRGSKARSSVTTEKNKHTKHWI